MLSFFRTHLSLTQTGFKHAAVWQPPLRMASDRPSDRATYLGMEEPSGIESLKRGRGRGGDAGPGADTPLRAVNAAAVAAAPKPTEAMTMGI